MTRYETGVRDAICETFARMPELDDADIRPVVRCGVVVLLGDVDDHHAAWCAVHAARDVWGVIHVRSGLVVRPELADERAPLETEFRDPEDAWFMTSPDYRWVDQI